MITFETQEEFEEAVMNVLHERLCVRVSSDEQVSISLWEYSPNNDTHYCIHEADS